MRTVNFVIGLAIIVLTGHHCHAQTVALSVGTGRALPGTTLMLPVSLATNGADPAAVQFTLSWETATISSISATAGPAATGAEKTITCQQAPRALSGSVTCLLAGLNGVPIAAGVIANAAVTLQSTASGTAPIGLTGIIASSVSGTSLAASGTGTTVTIGEPLPDATLSVGAAAGPVTAGGTLTFPVSLAVPSSGPASLQWTVSWAASDIASVSVAAGPAATAADKSVVCNSGPISITCVASGLNTNTMSSGVIANVTARLTSTPSAAVPIGLAGVIATSDTGTAMNVIAVSGVLALLKSVSCTPRSFMTPGSTTCTVTLNAAAPAAGVPITISADRTGVTAPSVTIASGSLSAQFVVSAAKVIASTGVTISAAAGPATAKYAIILLPPPSLLSLKCGPSVLTPGASTSCTVALTGLPAAPFTVSLSANNPALLIPGSVVIPAGKLSATFSVVAGGVLTPQTVIVTAAADGVSKTASVSVNPAPSADARFRAGPAGAVFTNVRKPLCGGLVRCV